MSDVLVLCYHALSDDWPADLSTTPELFQSQLEYLLARGYEGATFEQAVTDPPARRTVAITFDDAYRSVLDHAQPIMQRLGVPGTVFVPTSFAGTSRPMAWDGVDRWLGGPHEQELYCMTWEEIRRLREGGWEVGSHTRTHPHLTTLEDGRLEEELRGSRDDCAAAMGECRSIAYPYGDVDRRVVHAARTAGYSVAAGLPNRLGSTDPLDYARVGVYHGDDLRRFKLKVSPALRRVRGSRAWDAAAARRDRRRTAAAGDGGTEPARRGRMERFLSSTFNEPVGRNIGEYGLLGYHIDLRVKARTPDLAEAWPWRPGEQSWVAFAQLGLGGFERFVAGDGDRWLALARAVGNVLCEQQTPDGRWEHSFDLPHTYRLPAPWISAMSQGQGSSLLTRLSLEFGDDRYSEAALRALGPMAVPVEDGGASAQLDGQPFPQEYPTDPPSSVLNGGMFAMWGWYDAGRGLGDAGSAAAFERAVDVLAQNLHRWDTGSWSRYDLYPHPIANLASFAYHRLHIDQLTAMARIAPRPEFTATAERFERYSESRVRRIRAFARKGAFRVLVPRRRPR